MKVKNTLTNGNEKEVTKESQCKRLLAFLNAHGSVTCLDGFRELGIVSFPRRILDLKRKGIKITDEWVVVKNRYGEKCRVKEYRLAK